MPNIEIPFIGGAYTTRSKNLNAQVCQNYYVEVDQTGAKNIISLTGCPGLTLWKDTGSYGEVRTFHVYNDELYAVVGNILYKVDEASATSIGTIGTSSGWVDTTNDGVYMGVFDSTGGWTWDGTDFTEITADGFQIPSSATYLGGYHIISRAGTDQFFISKQDDPTVWDATKFATGESHADILVRIKSVRGQLWLLGKETAEVWYLSGDTFPFTRNPGGFIKIGCGAKRSVADHEDILFWLDDKYKVVMGVGISIKPISTYQIDYQISLMNNKSDAVGFCYFDEGHSFYELTCDSKTFCYDITTGFWHTRASGAADYRNRPNCAVRFDGKVLVGDFENGKIYEYSLDAYDDDGTVKRAIRAAQTIHNNRQNIFFNSFELDLETGIANASVSNPQIVLQWSDDGGHTWSNEHWKSLGVVGRYKTRARWLRLGRSRNRIFRTIVSDAVKRNIINAHLDGTMGNS